MSLFLAYLGLLEDSSFLLCWRSHLPLSPGLFRWEPPGTALLSSSSGY